jgi:hypothetical protein
LTPLPVEIAPIIKIREPLWRLREPTRIAEAGVWLERGSATNVNFLLGAVDGGQAVEWDIVETIDLVGYLKLRLADFGPLISVDIWNAFLGAEQSVVGVGECLKTLPLTKRILLKQILTLLHRLQLDFTALAIGVLAPALANDQNLTNFDVQRKARLMIENAPEICNFM